MSLQFKVTLEQQFPRNDMQKFPRNEMHLPCIFLKETGKFLGQELFHLFASKENHQNRASADSGWHITPALTLIYRRKNHSPFQPVTFSKSPCPITSCFHLQQDFAFLFSFSNAISSQPDSCHASACFCCFHYWVSGEDYGSCDQSLMFASTAVVTQAKVNQAFWEIMLPLPGFLSIDIIAYTNPSLPFCEFFNLL